MSITREQLTKALEHAMNYHGIDARANTADYELAELIVDEVLKHLRGETDVQAYERGERPQAEG